jgi:hypothetical protein
VDTTGLVQEMQIGVGVDAVGNSHLLNTDRLAIEKVAWISVNKQTHIICIGWQLKLTTL